MDAVLPAGGNRRCPAAADGNKKTSEETEQPQETAARPAGDAGASVQEEMEQRLCDALSQMDGVGAVHVVVTLESTGKKIVEKDVPTRSTTEENKKGEETGSVTSSSQDEATVYEKTQNGAETPYVVPRSTRRCAACSLSQKAGETR